MEDVRVQKAVWLLDVGRGKRVVLWFGAVLLAMTLSLLYTADQFRGLERAEAMDMAQLGRNIARGRGFTTYVIRPLSLWQMTTIRSDHQPHFMDHPDLVNPPLYPLVLAALFKPLPDSLFEYKPTDMVYKPERWVILPFNQLCMLATVLLVYFWARRLFDEKVAITAGLLLLFSDTLWFFSISGLPTSMLMLMFLSALYCLWRADMLWHPEPADPTGAPPPRKHVVRREPKPWTGWVWVSVSAVLMGMCFLTRYSMAFLFIPMVVYAGRVCRGRGWGRGVVLYLLLYLIVIIPWLVRNTMVCGSPLGLALYEFANGISPSQFQPNFDHAFDIAPLGHRLLAQSHMYLLTAFKNLGADFLGFFFVVGLLYGFRREATMRLRRMVWAGLLCAILGLSCITVFFDVGEGPRQFVMGGNLLVLFLPLVAVYGAAFFFLLLDRIPFPARLLQLGVIALFLLANAAALLYSLLPPRRSPYPYPPYCAYYTSLAANWFEKDDVGASDMAWSVAWVGNRRCLWLPTTAEDLAKIHDQVAPKGISFILLTPYLLDRKFQSDFTKGEYKSWFAVVSGRVPQYFPLKTVTLFAPAGEQILYADRPRWANKNVGEAPTGEKKKTEESGSSTNAPPR